MLVSRDDLRRVLGGCAVAGPILFTLAAFVAWSVQDVYSARREDLLAGAAELFDVVASGAVRVKINHRYPLAEAADAHRALQARETTGSIILVPAKQGSG